MPSTSINVDSTGSLTTATSLTVTQMHSAAGNAIHLEDGYYSTTNISSASSGQSYGSTSGSICNVPYDMTGGGGLIGGGGTTIYPGTNTLPWQTIYTTPPAPEKRDELKSDPKEASPTSHTLKGVMRIYGDAVIIEYWCTHCNQVLHSEVISRVPKGIIEEKCLPKIVDGVK